MKKKQRYTGFSLTEILLAVGTLSIGLLFIAGTFMTGIYFSTIATERTTAAVAADEAFAKIRLYGIDPTDPNLTAGKMWPLNALTPITEDEQMYPSIDVPRSQKQYYWFALCRLVDPNSRLVQVTVVVNRIISGATYWVPDVDSPPALTWSALPRPVGIRVVHNTSSPYELVMNDPAPGDGIDVTSFINDGYKIIDSRTGHIYRVLERYADRPDTIRLDNPWRGGSSDWIFVFPPPRNGGRSPCIAIYQKIVRF
jgi:type II secretory pathway pseudopilin PulG